MLRIHLLTGTAWTKYIDVDGTEYDDIMRLIDEYYLENGELPVPMYTEKELVEMYNGMDGLEMLPINGGEFYIDGISHIEKLDGNTCM